MPIDSKPFSLVQPPCSRLVPIKTKIKGSITYIMVNYSKYKAYKIRPSRMENMCGFFVSSVPKTRVRKVLVSARTCLGKQESLYNLYGNGTFMHTSPNRMFFKGCQNLQAVKMLAQDVHQDLSPDVVVHMAVVSACLGELVDISSGGLMECVLSKLHIRSYRMIDTTNSICFRVNMTSFLTPEQVPRQNDWTITARGSVIVRITWDSVAWTEDIETNVLKFCDEQIRLFKEMLGEIHPTS